MRPKKHIDREPAYQIFVQSFEPKKPRRDLIERHLRYRLSHVYQVFKMSQDAFGIPSSARLALHFGLYPESRELGILHLCLREDLRCPPPQEPIETLDALIAYCMEHTSVTHQELEHAQYEMFLPEAV